ncbi:1293_t:CDS:2, partial [Gigaspora margarita]
MTTGTSENLSVDFNSLVAHGGSKCSDEEWSKYIEMPQVRTNETP